MKNAALPAKFPALRPMAALPAAYREALLLRYQQGYTVREMAPMLGKKQGTVQKLLTRAKAALRRELDERGIEHA